MSYYNSFYGGRQGASFVIVQSFSSIKDMVAEFSKGGEYTTVGYGEYVLIDTVNKADSDNGKIFRRGYDYASSRTIVSHGENINAGGAEFVGGIAGPAGAAPSLRLTSYADAEVKSALTEDTSHGSATMQNGSLVSGKTHDTIDWYTANIYSENGDAAIAYVGLRIPYHVTEFTAETVPSDAPAAVEKIDDGAHPFYAKWKISVPAGEDGKTFENLRIIVPTNSDNIYGVGTTTKYPDFDEDVAKKNSIIVYNQDDQVYYLGKYDMIKDVAFDKNTGALTIKFTASEDFTTSLPYVNELNLNSTGSITESYADGSTPRIINPKTPIKWINKVELTSTTTDGIACGGVLITYNTGDTTALTNAFNDIDTTAVRATDGHLLVLYSNPDKRAAIPAESKTYYKDRDDWFDLGPVKAESGIYVGKNYVLNDLGLTITSSVSEVVTKLNAKHPEGLVNAGEAGKLVSIGDLEDDKYLYAFDYTAKTWFYLGKASGSQPTVIKMCVLASDESSSSESLAAKLPAGSVWFIANDTLAAVMSSDEMTDADALSKMCVVVGKSDDLSTQSFASTLRAGSLWLVTESK